MSRRKREHTGSEYQVIFRREVMNFSFYGLNMIELYIWSDKEGSPKVPICLFGSDKMRADLYPLLIPMVGCGPNTILTGDLIYSRRHIWSEVIFPVKNLRWAEMRPRAAGLSIW